VKLNRKTLVLYVTVAFLFAVLIGSHLISSLYARYRTSVEGSSEATVAKFNVTINSTNINYSELFEIGEMIPGDTETIVFTVTNNSEVTIDFNVYAANITGNLPLEVPLKGTPEANTPITSQRLNQGESHEGTAKIVWNTENSSPSAAEKTDLIEFKIVAEQVD